MTTDIAIALAQAAENLMACGQAEKALTAGQHAPGLCLPNQDGVKTSSASILRLGPLLLIFYSGSWCPACNLSLRALEEVRPIIEARGASLIAISSQTIEENKNVGFEVPCGWWHSSLRHHAARRAAITIVYRLYGER
jgi:hypothetical protein